MKLPIAILSISALLALNVSAVEGLDGVVGNICKVDLEQRSFELLKETEYDPKTDLRQSRFTVYWTDKTTITKIEELKDFTGINGPVIASFQGIDGANAKALAGGKPFVARVATLLHGKSNSPAAVPGQQKLTGRFTPAAGKNPRNGIIEVNGKPVAVSMSKRNARIFAHEPLLPADLAMGFWKTTIHGTETGGRFIIDRMEVRPLPDPRATDDPKLPRVLVVGDSISMNYHEAAKAALKGVANYHRNEGNSGSTQFGVANMDLWLGDWQEKGLHWDVIQFNHGLHDLKQSYDAATDRFGDHAVPMEDYKKNLEKEIAILKQTGAKLIWCSTTPVPNHNKGTYARRKGAEREFNQAAMEVMRRHPEIQINDLCQLIDNSPAFDNWRKGADVHFYKEGERKLLGEAVAAAVCKALEKPAKKLPVPAEVFSVEGHTAFLALPANRPSGTPVPWVWYAPTLPGLPSKQETWMFERFLVNGIAIAGVDVGESMGNPAGRAVFSNFYQELVTHRGMSRKPCLLARSRGGLMLYNWAVENPDSVAGIAGIYPVGNLASWPGLPKACTAYGITAEQLASQLDRHNPIERLAPLAKARVPVFHLHGDRDGIVPLDQNSGLVKQRYMDLGGAMTLEVIQGGGHDLKPHWFQSQSLVDFVITHAKGG